MGRDAFNLAEPFSASDDADAVLAAHVLKAKASKCDVWKAGDCRNYGRSRLGYTIPSFSGLGIPSVLNLAEEFSKAAAMVVVSRGHIRPVARFLGLWRRQHALPSRRPSTM